MQEKHAEHFSKNEDFLVYLSALVLVGILIVVVLLQWQSAAKQIFLIAVLLLFGGLILRMPESDEQNPRKIHYYLALQTLLVGLVISQSSLFVFLFFILSAQAMMTLNTRTGLAWLGGFALITLAGYLYHSPSDLLSVALNSLVNSAGFLFFGVFGNALMRASRAKIESQRLLAELTDAHQRLQSYAKQAEFLAVAEERNRLSRDLHDTLGHRLTVAIVQLEGATRLLELEPQRAAGMIETVRSQLSDGLEELRRTLKALRNPQITGSSLARSLRQLTAEFAAATKLRVHTQLPDELPPLSDAQRTTVYRAVQESLTNVQKHAQARNVWLALDTGEGRLILTVRDDGRGLAAANGHAPGMGLRGMRERASQLGGTLQITQPVGGGVLVTLSLPLQEMARA